MPPERGEGLGLGDHLHDEAEFYFVSLGASRDDG
jgi:hypothetical protein